MANVTLGSAFYLARKVSAPIVVVRTPDETATIATLAEFAAVPKSGAPNADKHPAHLVGFDTVRGVIGLNTSGANVVKEAIGHGATDVLNLSDALTYAVKFPAHTVLFVHLSHRHWNETAAVQATCNLRDVYKANFRTVVFLAPLGSRVPVEFAGDAVILNESLPDAKSLDALLVDLAESSEIDVSKDRKRAVDAVAGLTIFSAEQNYAMSLTKSGVDLDGLWERKRQTVEQIPGLAVKRDGFKFDSVIGYDNAKSYLRKVVDRFNVVLFIDEIDKGLSGWNSDTSGVSQDFHQALLTFMDKPNVMGVMLVGHRGTGKTATATAIGNEAGIPTVVFDMGGMKAKHVGDSEANVRTALATTEAIGQGRVLVIATCNRASGLSPEIMRRFGTPFYFELPSSGELSGMWDLYIARPHVEAAEPLSAAQTKVRPTDLGWTGSDVKRCCETAWRLGCTLTEAAAFVVPVALGRPDEVNRLRAEADGAYIDASRPGAYRIDPAQREPVVEDASKLHPVVKRALAGMKES